MSINTESGSKERLLLKDDFSISSWKSEEVKKPELWEGISPIDEAGPISRMFYSWTNSLLKFAAKKGRLTPENIGRLS